MAAFNVTIPAMAASGSAAFTLTPTDDDVDEDSETIDVTGALAGTTVTKATVTLTDDDTRGVTVTGSPLTLDEADDAETDAKENEGSYTVVLTSRPTASVTINISAGASAPVTLDKASLTFAPGDWNTAQTVTVTAVDDAYDNAGDERAASIAHTVVAGASDYGSVTVDPVSVTVTDDDDAPSAIILTVDADTGTDGVQTSVAEGGGAKTVRVTATLSGNSRFPAAKTVVLAVGKATDSAKEGTDYTEVVAVSITIQANAASGSATFTLTPADDSIDDDAESLTIEGSVTGESGVTVSPVSITIDDNDGAPTGIALSANPSTVAENAATAATITVTATVTGGTAYNTDTDVAITVGDADDTAKSGTDYAVVTGFTIRIPAGQTSAEGSFDLNPTNDALDEANETISVKGASGALKVTKATVTLTDDDPLPSLSIDSPSVAEGDAGETATLTFTVTLGAASGRQVTVGYSRTGGTATSGDDFDAVDAGTLTFAPGETSKTIAVTVNGDAIDEDNETVVLRLSSPANATVGTADGTGTITDDDAPPTVRVDNAAAVAEGDDPATATNMTFPVTLSAASGKAVTVAYALGGTATAGADYTAPNPLSLTIAAGTATANILVPIKGDELDEPNETVTVTLGTLANATLDSAQGAGTATGTITDDEGTPTATLSLSPAAINESGNGNASTVTATLSQASSQDLTLTVSAGSGVTLSSNKVLTIDAGETESKGTVTLTAEDNDVDAADLEVAVSAAATGGNGIANPADQTLTVRDDDARGVTVSKASLSVRETDDGTTDSVKENEGTYTVVLDSEPAAGTVTVAVTSGDTKAATVSPASLTFNTTNWSTAQTVTVTSVDDNTDNTDDKRDLSVTHTVSTTGTGNDYAALKTADPVTVTVTDDDAAPTGITLTVNEETVGEEDATATTVTVTATVNGATRYTDAKTVVVSVGAGASTATSAADYAAVANFEITIAAGAANATGTFDLTPAQDTLHEGTETIDVTGASGTLKVTKATINLTDDDSAPSFAVADASAAEGDAMTFTVTRSGATGAAAAVKWNTADDTAEDAKQATAGADYTAVTTARTLSFAIGESAKTFTVATAEDTLHEGDETFLVKLSGATGATIATAEATGTITDDDAKPTKLTLAVDADTGTDNDQNSIAENGGAKTVRVTATLGGTSTFTTATTVTVKVGTSDDSATEATDYEAVADQTITIPAGKASAHVDFTLTPKQDVLAEGDETIALEGSATGLDITDTEITLNDDDAAPTGITLAAAPDTLGEGAAETEITVTATVNGTTRYEDSVTVAVSVGGGSAISGTDYGAVAGFNIVIPAGAASATGTFDLDPTQDTLHEGAETIDVSGVSGTLTVTKAVISLTDDDSAPSFAVADASAAEGDAVTFTVTRSGATGAAAAVKWNTADDTAEDAKQAAAGTDYTAVTTARTLSFAIGDTSKTFTVATTEDTLAEGDETFLVKLSDATGATISDDTATGTITDDDAAPTALTLTVDADTGTQGVQGSIAEDGGRKTARVTATLGGASTFTTATTVTVTVGKSDDSATEARDYEAVADQTITIAAGASSAYVDFDITPKQDALHEGAERISLGGSATGLTVTDAAISLTDDEATPTATLALTPATINESGDGNASTVTATLNRASSQDLTLTVSAGAGVTLSANKALTIEAGDTDSKGTVTLTAEDNDVDAADLRVTVSATASGGNGVGSPANQTLTVRDDDTRGVTVSKTGLSLAEADDATTTDAKENEAAYTVVLDSEPAAGTVTVTVASGDATVATASPRTLTFTTATWDDPQTVTVTAVADDADNAGDERAARITHALAATGAGNDYGGTDVDPVTVAVADDDTAELSIADAAAAEGGTATFKVTLSAPSAAEVAVTATTAEGSATDPEDYAHKAQTLTFAAGETSKDFTVAIASDALVELDETFTVTLSGASGAAIIDATATGTITGAGALLSISDASAREGADLTFTVTRTGDATGAASVQWSTGDDATSGARKAAAGADYTAVSTARTLSFAKDETAKTLAVTSLADALLDGDETFAVTLAGPTGAVLANAAGTGTITEGTTGYSVADASAAEGGALAFAVTRAGWTGAASTVKWNTADDTADGADKATAGADYSAQATAATLSFKAGETSADIEVSSAEDALDEPDETFRVALSAPSGSAVLTDAEAVGTITDDDGTPAVSVADAAAVEEGDAGETASMTFAVTLSAASGRAVAVPYTLGGTAESGTDYAPPNPLSVTIAAGADSADIDIAVTGDDRHEADETVTVTLGAPTNATVSTTVGAGTGTGQITNDDDAPTGIALSANPSTVAENAATAATITVTATVTGGTTFEAETTVAVTVGDADDTATSGEDYAAVQSFDIDIPAGAASATGSFSLDPTDDAIAEGAEKLTVSGASGDIDVESAEVTITDDEGTPTATLVLSPATIDESGADNASTVTATLDRASSQDLTLTVSAGAGVTLSANKVLTIDAGETESEGTVTLTAADNDVDAADLAVTVSATASGGNGVANPADRTLTVRDDDTRGVTVAPKTLTVRETDDSTTNGDNESEETYTVVLDSEPAAGTVTVAVTSGDTEAATVSPPSLTFNTTNWNTAQTVTVTGVDDDTDNANDRRVATVTHAVSTTGDGNDYAALESADPVTVTVADDDAAPGGITLSVDTPSLGEGAGATEVTVTATVTGTTRFAKAQTVAVSVGGGTATSATDYEAVAAFNITIPAGEASATGTFDLTPADDDVDEDSETIDVTGSLAGVTVTKATVTLTDDDTRGVTVTGSPLTISEADDAQTTDAKENEGSYTVVLDSRPTASVTINLSAGVSAPVTLDKTSLTFAPGEWNTAQTVKVTAVDDAYDNPGDERSASIAHTVVAGTSDYGGVTAVPVAVTVNDDDAAPSRITLTVDADTGTQGVQASVGEGGGAKTVRVTATLAGNSRFPAAKTVVLAVGKATDSAVEGTDYSEVGAVSITIQANAASGNATFTLTPADDTIDDDAESLTIEGSVTGESGVTVSPVSITIDDNDGAPTGIALSANPSTVAENAATAATITVTATVTGGTTFEAETTVAVTVGGADDTATSGDDYAAVQSFDIDIPSGTTSATGSFSLAPTDDAIAEGAEKLTVSGASGSIKVTETEVTITDDEGTPTATLVLTPATIDESGADNASTVTATLNRASSQNLTLTVSAGSGVTLSTNKVLTIDAGETASEGTVTLTATDNDVDAADLEVTVSAVASGGNGVANPASQTLTIRDDDTRGVTVAPKTLTVRETDDSTTNGKEEHKDTYTVVLDSEPAAGTVTVDVTSGDTKGATVSPPSLTFNTANWSTAQTVTVTGVDDDTDNTGDKRTLSVTHAVSTTGDGNDYAALESADPVTVTVADDDAAPGGITLSVDTPSLGEGAGATEVTVTATVTGATRFAEAQTVVVSVGGGTATSATDYEAVAAFNLTIPAMAASGSATFTLTPTDDDVDEDGETIDVTGTLTGVTVTKATISLTDDDTRGVTVTGSPLTISEADDAETDAKENEGSYTVVLDSRPTASVTINISAGASAPVTLDKASLTFAPGDWNTAQTVTVTAVDDAYDNAGDERSASITHTVVAGTSDYGSVTVTPVAVTVTDDDAAPSAITLTVDADTGTDGVQTSVAEGGGAKTVRVTATLAGNSRFPAAKTVVLAVGKATDSAKEGTDYTEVGAVSITIDANAASGSATFTLTPADDTIDDDAESLTIEGSVTGESGVTVSPASITIDDNDGAPTGIALSANPSTVAENAATAAAITVTATVKGGTAYDAETTVTVTVGDADDTAVSDTDYAEVADFDIDIPPGAASATGTFSLDPTDDAIAEGAEKLTVSGASGSIKVTDTEVTITDDEGTPTATLVLSSATINESGDGNASIVTATLSRASSKDLTLTVSAGSGVTLSTNKVLTIDAGETESEGTVTLTAEDNYVDAADLRVTVSATASGGNGIANPANQTLTVRDDDARGVTVSKASLSVREADDAETDAKENEGSYTVVLDSRPTANVVVNLSAGVNAPVTLDKARLTFAPAQWDTAQTVTVTAVDDAYDNAGDKRTASITHTVVAGTSDYGSVTVDPVSVTVNDDDTAPSAIALTVDADTGTDGVQTSVAEGGGAKTVRVTATLAGNSRFPAAKTVVLAVGKATDGAKEGTDYTEVGAVSITIDANAASGSATFTLTPADDTIDDDAESLTIEGSVTGESGVTVSPASITIDDNDGAPTGIALSAAPSTVAENAATAAKITVTATVTGGTAYDAETTVTVTVGDADDTATSGEDYAAVPSFDIDVPAGAASATGSFSLDPTDDAIAEGSEKLTVSGASGSIKVTNTEVTITDDEATPTATLALSPAAINESGADNASTVTATLNRASSQDLTLTVSAGSGVTLSANKVLTIDAGETESEGTVTLTATDNDVDAADIEVAVSATASGGNGLANPADRTLTVRDDDARGVTVAPKTLSVRETDDSTTDSVKENEGTYTVVLDSEPAAGTVTVAVTSGDTKAATVSPPSLTFNTTNWSAARTVTVTGVDDDTDNANDRRVVTVTHAVSSTGDGNDYAALESADPVTVTVADDDDAPGGIALSVDTPSVGEGAGATEVTVTATVTGATRFAEAQTVAVSVGGGTATSATDYKAVAAFNVTIPAMAASGSAAFTLTPTDDDVDEDNETIDVTGALAGTTVTKATITLTDDDTRGVTVTGSPLTISEADDSQTDAKENEGTYTVVLDSRPTSTVVVNLSAGVNAPVTLDKARLTFAPDDWNTAQTVTVTAVDDAYDNPGDERSASITHTVVAGTSDYGGVTAVPVAVTVNDDDAAPSRITLTVDADTGTQGVQTSVGEGGGAKTVRVTATLAGNSRFPAAKTVVLAVGKATDSAVEGTDYTEVGAVSITIDANAASGSATFTLTPINDSIDDDAESLTIEGSVTGESGVTVSPASIAIDDNDGAPTGIALSVSPNSVAEDAAQAATITVTATATGGTAFEAETTVAVTVGNSSDSAKSGVDYAAVPAFDIDIPAGATSAIGTFSLNPTNDALAERDETLTVSGASGSIAVESAEVTITDNDDAPSEITITAGTGQQRTLNVVAEAGGAQTVRVTAALQGTTTFTEDKEVSVTVGKATDSATEGTDYETVGDLTLTIDAGQSSGQLEFTLTPKDDLLDEDDETISIEGTLGDLEVDFASVTITDDDATPTLSVADATAVEEGDAGETASMTFTVTLSAASGRAVAVPYTLGGTAESGTDYTPPNPLSAAIAAGATSADIDITVTGDDRHEADETVIVTLGAPVNATVSTAAGAGTGTGQITNDDDAPTGIALSANPSTVAENAATAATITVTATVTGGGTTFDGGNHRHRDSRRRGRHGGVGRPTTRR